MMTEKVKPRIGTETGAKWKDQEKCLEPKLRGITRAPNQGSGKPPAVRSLVLERGADGVGETCGKTEMEAPVLTRNLKPDIES